MNLVIEDLVEQEPNDNPNSFIITNGENKNKISYMNINSGNRQYFLPNQPMIAYILKHNDFYIFDLNEWKKLSVSSNNEIGGNLDNEQKFEFINIQKNFLIKEDSNQIMYLYVSKDTKINISEIKFNECTLVIKSNCEKKARLEWDYNILWPNKIPPLIGDTINAINIVKLYKFEKNDEKSYYLGTCELNYQY